MCSLPKAGLFADRTTRDRRKLTFYFKADKRVDFRELTKENFRIFKVSNSQCLGYADLYL